MSSVFWRCLCAGAESYNELGDDKVSSKNVKAKAVLCDACKKRKTVNQFGICSCGNECIDCLLQDVGNQYYRPPEPRCLSLFSVHKSLQDPGFSSSVTQQSGVIAGIGVLIEEVEGKFFIFRLLDGGPAKKCGKFEVRVLPECTFLFHVSCRHKHGIFRLLSVCSLSMEKMLMGHLSRRLQVESGGWKEHQLISRCARPPPRLRNNGFVAEWWAQVMPLMPAREGDSDSLMVTLARSRMDLPATKLPTRSARFRGLECLFQHHCALCRLSVLAHEVACNECGVAIPRPPSAKPKKREAPVPAASTSAQGSAADTPLEEAAATVPSAPSTLFTHARHHHEMQAETQTENAYAWLKMQLAARSSQQLPHARTHVYTHARTHA